MRFYDEIKDCPYKIKYAQIPSKTIWNFLEIPANLRQQKQDFYDDLEASILKEGVRNPILVMALKRYPPVKLNKKLRKKSNWRSYHQRHDFWWTNDENEPIWLPRKKTPENCIDKDGVLLICRMLGGSRLWACQKHDLDIPCIISDYCDKFPGLQPLKSQEDILKHFQNSPGKVGFNSYGVFHFFKDG